jgi:excinuclease ABC subunit B
MLGRFSVFMNKPFKIHSKYEPAGDQPKAIEKLSRGLEKEYKNQTLLGVTGSGKTFTMAGVIEKTQRPALVIAHNKTLAAQLCNEFKFLFPENAVEYFVSYYDYYQPEAYIPTSDTYIGKEAMINDEIDKLRHRATTAALTRKDVIIVASVSCIYGLGEPETYKKKILHLKKGDKVDRKEFVQELVRIQYSRTNSDLQRGTFRLRGDQWEIMPPYENLVYNFEIKEGKINDIFVIDPVKGFVPGETLTTEEVFVSPARHFVTEKISRDKAIKNIEKELKEQLKKFKKEGKFLEMERLERRTKNDVAMIREIGYCNGIENYSRHLSGRESGEPPATLLDYMPEDFITIIDESHVTVPQLWGMYGGDRARKETLIEYGFRLPSAIDNRPLKKDEFENKIGRRIYTSATPADYEKEKSNQIVEQIIRPTGLIDPKITLRPAKGQVEDLIPRIQKRVEEGDRVLVTTLTKKMAEDLSEYLKEKGLRVSYLHSDVKTLDRIRILTKLRKGEIQTLVGVNLLREGLDLPEVSLVAILDADKEGFLRSETSLIQVIGRAARNVKGEVLIYADNETGSVKRAINETKRRRKIQMEYNKKYGITPKTIVKDISDIAPVDVSKTLELENKPLPKNEKEAKKLIKEKEREMKKAAEGLDFELAAILRDEIKELSKEVNKK